MKMTQELEKCKICHDVEISKWASNGHGMCKACRVLARKFFYGKVGFVPPKQKEMKCKCGKTVMRVGTHNPKCSDCRAKDVRESALKRLKVLRNLNKGAIIDSDVTKIKK